MVLQHSLLEIAMITCRAKNRGSAPGFARDKIAEALKENPASICLAGYGSLPVRGIPLVRHWISYLRMPSISYLAIPAGIST
ncbi:MAG: hypothetical protein ACPL7K_09800, partial [Armatimonadota bacterium]